MRLSFDRPAIQTGGMARPAIKVAGARGHSAPGVPKRFALAFSLRFLALVFLISALSRVDLVVFDGAASRVLTHQSASAVALAFGFLGQDVRRAGNTLDYRGSVFKVIDECTGIEVIALFAAAVLAFPSRWRHRLTGLALGISALALLNLIRMVTLVWLGSTSPDALEYGHVYVWPTIILTVTLGIWLHWARIAAGDANSAV
jgi:exosortase H (IPTLxxWG-CTERM-specific)